MSKLQIGKTDDGHKLSLDIGRLITSRLLVTASSGGGKSWLLRRILEEVSESTQTIVIDTEGEFATLRELRDMVLAGPAGEVPAEPRSASLLCRRLMEMNISAVIDVSELARADKNQFVANFCNTLVDLPRALWRPCVVAIDETHEYAAEKEPSESGKAISLLVSKGRKRGYCLLGATQRLSKLEKDVAAELKNVFIGQMHLDVDLKRAANTLGFDTKRWPEIRDLSSEKGHEGEFFAFGPALNARGVVKFRSSGVRTTHPKAGHGRLAKPPAPSAKIRGVLDEMKDLPQQAETEIRDLAEAKKRISQLEREAKALAKAAPVAAPDTKAVERAAQTAKTQAERESGKTLASQAKRIEQLRTAMEAAMKFIITINAQDFFGKAGESLDEAQIQRSLVAAMKEIGRQMDRRFEGQRAAFEAWRKEGAALMRKLEKLLAAEEIPVTVTVKHNERFTAKPAANGTGRENATPARDVSGRDELEGPQRRVLDSLAFWELVGVATPGDAAVALKAGYSPTSSAYERPRGALRSMGLMSFAGSDARQLTERGRELAEFPGSPGTIEELHGQIMGVLPGPEQKLLRNLIAAYPDAISNEHLAEASGYSHTSSAYERPRGKLRTIGLAEFRDGGVAATEVLFPASLR